MRTLAAMGVLVGLWACGTVPAPDAVQFSVPFQAAVTNCTTSHLSTMTAVASIGGHPDCTLQVDSSTLVAHGACPHITTGIVRPVMIVYSLPNPAGGDPAPLAANIGWVDLDKSALKKGQTSVPVNVGTDGSTGVIVTGPNPDGSSQLDTDIASAPAGSNMLMALQWAKVQIDTHAYNFDLDNDNNPNLDEICASSCGPANFFQDTGLTDTNCP